MASKGFLKFESITATTAGQFFAGGIATAAVSGTFNSATVALQASFDGGTTYIAVGDDVSFTANGMGNVELPECMVRFAVSGGTPSSMTGYVSAAYSRKYLPK